MDNLKKYTPTLFIVVGLAWLALGITGATNIALGLGIGVTFFVIGLALNAKNKKTGG